MQMYEVVVRNVGQTYSRDEVVWINPEAVQMVQKTDDNRYILYIGGRVYATQDIGFVERLLPKVTKAKPKKTSGTKNDQTS